MERAARVGIVVSGVLALVLCGLVVSVQFSRRTASSILARSGKPQVLFMPGQTDVVLTRLEQPMRACPATQRVTDIVLLLDRSGSMQDNNALASAITAAQQFVETVDLSTSRVAIAYFNDMVEVRQSLTHDPESLIAALAQRVTANGNTDIAAGLFQGGELLSVTSSSPEIVPIIVLLTDGGSDPVMAHEVGNKLKQAGVRIVTIALPTENSNLNLLRQLASAPTDFYESPTPTDLQEIYGRLAEQINQTVAYDVVVTEKVNEALTLLPDSVVPMGAIAGNSITWEIPSLSNQAITFTYAVAPSQVGRYLLNEEPTNMSYTDCAVGAVSEHLAAGTALLVLPPLWSIAGLFLLPLMPFFLLSWFRRSKPVAAPTSSSPIFEAEPPPERYPEWLQRLDNYRQTFTSEELVKTPENLTPTMIVGLGPVGREVLSEIARTLRVRYGGQLPDAIRLLQIDLQPAGLGGSELSRPAELLPEEWILLQPNLQEISQNLQRNPEKWPYLSWYEPTASEDYARSHGRAALFYDLKDGADRSAVWRGLTRAANKLQKPYLRLVGSTFDDTSSGMLVDIAWLMQMITNSQVDVELWLCGPLNEDWSSRLTNPRQRIRVSDQQVRTLATLRELERFQRNAVIPFYYVSAVNIQTQLHRRAEAAVVQTLFLFVPTNDQTVDDHLSTIADSLMAIIYKDAQQMFKQHLVRTEARANVLTNSLGMGMVCSVGAYAIRMPLGLLEEALCWRFLFELLFESQIGLLPLAQLQQDGTYHPLTSDDFPDNAAQRRESAEQFVQRFRRRWGSRDFQYALTRRISETLNGEEASQPAVLTRVGGIVRVTRWLESVRNALNMEGEIEAAQKVNRLRNELLDCQSALEAIKPLVEERWQTARQRLQTLKAQQNRHWAIPDDLEWTAYQQRLRLWLAPPTKNLSAEPLFRAAKRFGWHFYYQETRQEWLVELWIPSIDYVWAGLENADDSLEFTAPLQKPNELIQRLYTMAQPLVRHRAAVHYAQDVAERMDPNDLLSQAQPRLAFDGMHASGLLELIGGMAEQAILVAPRSERARNLQRALQQISEKMNVALCETDDETTVTLLRVRDRIPLITCNVYNEAAWLDNFVSAGIYVWRGEQLAALAESGQRLSSQFVGWLEQDANLVSLFAQAYLFSLLEKENDNDLSLPGIGSWPGKTVGDGLANLLGPDQSNWPVVFLNPKRKEAALQALATQIQQTREKIWQDPNTGKRTYQRLAEQKLVNPLATSNDQRQKELAIYLQAILQQW